MAHSLAEVLEEQGPGMRFEEKVTATAAFTGSPNVCTFKLATPVPAGYVAHVDHVVWPLFAGSPAAGDLSFYDDQDGTISYRVVKPTAAFTAAGELVGSTSIPVAQGMIPGKKPIFQVTSAGATGSPVLVFRGRLVKQTRPVV